MSAKIMFYDVPMYSVEFRKFVAETIDSPFMSAVMNYSGDAPAQKSPAVRFCSNLKHVWINVLTDEAEKSVLPTVGDIARAFLKRNGHVPRVQIIDLPLDATALPYDRTYRLAGMAVSVPREFRKDHDKARKWLETHLHERMWQSFCRQVSDLSITSVSDQLLAENPFTPDGIRIQRIVPFQPFLNKKSSRFMLKVSANVLCKANFSDGWAFGRLLGYGHGNLIHHHSDSMIRSALKAVNKDKNEGA